MAESILESKTDRAIAKFLRSRNREATVADVASGTALPLRPVEATLQRFLARFRGELRVTENGELLYYFPNGLRDRDRGLRAALRRFLARAIRTAGRVLSFLFKVWISTMLVGYFALFVALLVAGIVASFAASAAGRGESRSRNRGGGFGSFYLTTRLIQLAFYLLLYSGPKRRARATRSRPLHRSVFAYVFGDEDPNAGWDEEAKRLTIAEIRRMNGVITPVEVAYLTGLGYTESQHLLHHMLLEYDGSPEVTEEGSIYYRFPELMKTADSENAASGFGAPGVAKRRLVPFNENEGKLNGWITFFNGFNLVFGSYFLLFAGGLVPVAGRIAVPFAFVRELVSNFFSAPETLVFYGLGVIPVVFSICFFGVTLLRRRRDARRNRRNRVHNRRRRILREIIDRPDGVVLEGISFSDDESVADPERIETETLGDLSSVYEIRIDERDDGERIYALPDLDRMTRDIAHLRDSIDPTEYRIGSVVYDSGKPVETDQ